MIPSMAQSSKKSIHVDVYRSVEVPRNDIVYFPFPTWNSINIIPVNPFSSFLKDQSDFFSIEYFISSPTSRLPKGFLISFSFFELPFGKEAKISFP